MPTNAERAAAAKLYLEKTTDSYPTWKRKGFPNTNWSKAFAELDAIVGASPPPPPPSGGWGAKLTPPPSVLANPPTRVVNITPQASGYTTVNGATDTIFKVAPGTYGSTFYVDGDFERCIFEMQGYKSVGAHDGIKNTGALTDVVMRGYDIAGVRSTGFLSDGPLVRVWRHGVIRDNNPNFAYGNQRNFHAYYIGPHGVSRHVVTSGQVIRQKNGYPFHFYSHYSDADGVYDSVIASMTLLECGDGGDDGNFLDVGVGLWLVHGGRITIANTLALRCKRQMAAVANYSSGGPITFVQSANVDQTGIKCDWGRDDQLIGGPYSTSNLTGDNGFRVPADTRTTGIGAYA